MLSPASDSTSVCDEGVVRFANLCCEPVREGSHVNSVAVSWHVWWPDGVLRDQCRRCCSEGVGFALSLSTFRVAFDLRR